MLTEYHLKYCHHRHIIIINPRSRRGTHIASLQHHNHDELRAPILQQGDDQSLCELDVVICLTGDVSRAGWGTGGNVYI